MFCQTKLKKKEYENLFIKTVWDLMFLSCF